MKLVRTCAAFVVLVSSPAIAQQGVTLVMSETRGGQAGQTRMQLDPTHVRVDITDRGQQVLVIYDAAAQTMRIAELGSRTYTEMGAKEMERIGGAVAGMQAQMEKQLAAMPPEQRKMLEDMLKARGGGAGLLGGGGAPLRTTFKRTGTGKAGQWACTTYDGFRGAEKVQEICATDSGIDLTANDFRAVQQLAGLLQRINPQQADQLASFGTAESQGFSGFPIRRVSFRNGQPDSTTELVEVRRGAIPASAWTLPEGLKRQELAMPR